MILKKIINYLMDFSNFQILFVKITIILNKSKLIFEFTLFVILIKYKDNCKGFLPNNRIIELFDNNLNESETLIKKYFDLLL